MLPEASMDGNKVMRTRQGYEAHHNDHDANGDGA